MWRQALDSAIISERKQFFYSFEKNMNLFTESVIISKTVALNSVEEIEHMILDDLLYSLISISEGLRHDILQTKET